MRTDSFFDQQRAREVECWAITQWRFDSRGADQRAATRLRWPHNRLAPGHRSLRAGPVRERMVAHPRRGTAERLHPIRYRSRKLELTHYIR